MSALHCTKWILVLVIDRYDLLVFCRPFSVCKVHCMKFVKTKPSSSGMSYCNHLLFVLALTFEWLVLPNESVSHNCTSPRIARGIIFDKRCRHTSLWFVWELPRNKSCIQHTILEHYRHLLGISCSDWIQECLKKNTSVCTKPRRYYEGSYHLPPPPPKKKKTLCPANSIRKMWSRSVNFRNMVKKEC